MHVTSPIRAITAAALLAGAAAQAASFDCAQAKTPVEQTICGHAKLSTLDERIAKSYQRALQALSPAGAAALKTSQRAWLRYLPPVCAPAGRADERCLTRELQNRLRRLDQSGVKVGALVLTTADRYEALPAPPDDATGNPPGVVTHQVGRVQIDAAATPAQLAWNRAQQPPEPPPLPMDGDDDSTSDLYSDTTITCASPRLLSIASTNYRYPHGAAHGISVTSATTVLPQAGLRALTAADLFAPTSGWQAALPTLFWQAHVAEGDVSKTAEVEQAIRTAALQERRWLVTPQGLRIAFNAYEGGSYVGTPGPITVTWTALKRLLADPVAPTCDASFTDDR